MTINDLAEGQRAQILGVQGLDAQLTQKLVDLGMIKGVRVTLIHRAPLGDPLWLELKGYQLSLRRELAEHIAVEEIE